MGEWMYIFLTSALAGGEWSDSRPCRFTPGGKSHRYPLDRRLGGPQNRSERREMEVVQPVASRYTDYAISDNIKMVLKGIEDESVYWIRLAQEMD
jgi:hypothetical protein